MKLDLHIHSNASDGNLRPSELIEYAARLGVTSLALTDHDTMNGIDEARNAADKMGIEFLPGVELSTLDGEVEVHMLGYFSSMPQAIQQRLEELRQLRIARLDRIIRGLNSSGIELDHGDIEKTDGAAPGRVHVARALIGKGYATTVSDAFKRYLVPGKPGFFQREKLSPEEAVELIHDGGGLAVLAHPGIIQADPRTLGARILRYLDAGMDGVEVYHSRHTPTERRRFRELASDNRRLITGGSDYHGLPGAVLPGGNFDAWEHAEQDYSQFLSELRQES